MTLKTITQQTVALVAVALMGLTSACSSLGGSNNSQNTRERVNAEAVGGSVAPLFAVTNGGSPALKLKGSEDPTSICVDEEVSEDGLTFSNEIPEGHYGLAGGGLDVSDETDCAETGFLHWTLDDASGEDCTGDSMEVSGEGIVGYGTTSDGETVLIVVGSYTIAGLDITCDIIITDTSFSASCEADGEALETDSCEAEEEDEDDSEEDSCEFAACSMDANDDGVEDDPDHFECQLRADDDSSDEFETDNVACVEGCCVIAD